MTTPNLPRSTRRLKLRKFTETDAARYHSYRSLPETVRYIYLPPITVQESVERMPKYAGLEFEADGDAFILAIQPKDATELAGEILLKYESVAGKQGELGYSLHPDCRGKGYVTEAAVEMLRLGFEHFGFHRIFARIATANTSSVRVAERLGMRREAHLIESEFCNGEWDSEYVYAILASEWRARK